LCSLRLSVGGKNVLKSWFNYRKKDPGGKKNYPLDLIYPQDWKSDWTTALIDLLTVLTRLNDLQPAQADLLDRALSGRLISASDLQTSCTRGLRCHAIGPPVPHRQPRNIESRRRKFLLSMTDEGDA
jgi:hypothetical protein